MGEALLKVLLVDDEPFILQGLKILRQRVVPALKAER